MIFSVVLGMQFVAFSQPHSQKCAKKWGKHHASKKCYKLEQNKEVVERYFYDVIDRLGVGDTEPDEWLAQADEVEEVIAEIFAEDAVQYFPGLPPSSPWGLLDAIRMGGVESMVTTINNIIAEGDLVSIHISHELTLKVGAFPRPRIGCLFPIEEVTIVRWDAIVFFELEDGKIVEERISRDDLGILSQLGEITVEPCIPLTPPMP